MNSTYDVFLSHRSLAKPWVECLARNLQARGCRVFLDDWELVPGHSFVEGLDTALRQARKGVLVATPGAVESGWVRMEYEAMLARSRREPDFSFVPLVFGEIPELPFLDTVHCVDFRDPSPEAYRKAFYRLLCGLEDRPPGPEATLSGKLEIPAVRWAPPTPLLTEGGEQRFLEAIFTSLAINPILLLLAQADRGQGVLIEGILERARGLYGQHGTLHVTPPYSEAAELEQYFQRLGRQCGFAAVRGSVDWDDALDERLSRGEQLFVLVSGFENGSESGRREFAGTLRGLGDRHASRLRVVLCGGERLAELKYGPEELSLLNLAEQLSWPEPTVADVVAWQQRDDPDSELDAAWAREVLELCGGHPRLIRHCLRCRQEHPHMSMDACREALRRYPFLTQLFLPYRGTDDQRQVCAWLARGDLGEDEPWPENLLVRRLYWGNLLAARQGRLSWRCGVLRDEGRRVLGCEGSESR